ncbi:diguanylate cyclase (GGDEF) domain-containing protein [Friedmanniella luteola]|uniref:Diguanylate cyclase (GGDEF) domain-containing protein n=1 Tax=Friedmanniella luteola TaxID=546871 RepID=A0A1H1SZT1_9ACTN|nr:diguanylate cyclase (GGDEF) domain-containing protein [Friedmanniella luteola]
MVGGAAVAAYVSLPPGLGRDGLFLVVGLAQAAALVAGVRLHRPVSPTPWLLMAAGQMLWVLASVVGAATGETAAIDGSPGLVDVCYLLGYLVLGIGLFQLARIRRPPRDLGGFLDSAIITVGFSLLCWEIVAAPSLAAYDGSGAGTALVVAVAYPLADVMLLGVLVALLTIPGRRLPALRLLTTALVLLIAADLGTAALRGVSSAGPTAMNPLWLGSYVVWGATALHPSMRELSVPTTAEPRLGPALMTALTLAVLVPPGVLAVQQLAGRRLDVWPVLGCAVLLISLMIFRLWLAIAQMTTAIRARGRAQADLARQASLDPLTMLPNRTQAMRLLAGALAQAKRSGTRVGLLFVDLDGFKAVNDRFGHGAGDEVLQVVSRRMAAVVRNGDVVARLGGDEFIVLLERITVSEEARAVAQRVVQALAETILLDDGLRAAQVGASVGIALSQDADVEPDVLLNEADIAAYRAKAGGRGRAEVFDQGLREELRQRAVVESGLAAALSADELELHYQPIVCVDTGEVEGYEALLRWRRDDALIPPDSFIPIAEESELICEVDAWVLQRAAQQLALWTRDWHRPDLVMAVNVSGRHAARARVIADVADAAQAAGIDPARLVLEVTETAMVDDPAAVVHLSELRSRGFAISLDDFGTGYSSLARLEQLPLDILKVDRKFLDPDVPSAAKLLPLIVHAGHAFGLTVVAEGVEHEHQLATLRILGCESAQGYHLGRPVRATDVRPATAGRQPTSPSGLPQAQAAAPATRP